MIDWLGMRKDAIKAVYYREWRVNRALYLIAGLLTILPCCLSLFANTMAPHRYVREFLTSVVVSSAHGDAGPSATFSIVLAGVLGLLVFWNDRSRGGIDAALEGPMSRRALMVGKLTLGVVTVLTAQVVVFLLLMVTALSVGRANAIGSLAAIMTLTLVASVCLMALTLAFSAAMGSPFFIALATFVWLTLPRVVATVSTNLTYLSTRMTVAEATAMNTTVTHIHWLSPLVAVLPSNGEALLYACYFALWAGAAVWAALVWWPHAPYEKLHAPLYFPWLWNIFYALLALVMGFVLANLGRTLGLGGWTFPGIYAHTLIIAIPAWFLCRLLFTRLGWSERRLRPKIPL